MNFVDYINLVPAVGWAILRGVQNIAHIVNAGMRRGVDFHNVYVLARGDCATIFTHATGICRWPIRRQAV